MKKLIIVLFVFAALVSCKGPKIVTEVRTETKWRDTTIYVKIPVYIDKVIEVPLPVHDTLKIVEKVFIDKDGYATMKFLHKEKGIIGADLSIYKGVFSANLYLMDSTILYRYKDTLSLEDSVRIYNAIRESSTTTTNTVIIPPERYVPKFFKFTLWFFILSVLVYAGIIVWKIKGGVYLKKIIELKNRVRGG
jgi:hypothetical protein